MRIAFRLLPWVMGVALLAQDKPPELTPAEKDFQDSMANVTLVGYFTAGESAQLREDRYVIERVSKVKDDLWKFEARIQYNKKDLKIALPLPVKWAGDTPVISITDFAVPGSGTYTARVLFYKDSYAGTWSGGSHGGKLFGKIVKNPAAPPQ